MNLYLVHIEMMDDGYIEDRNHESHAFLICADSFLKAVNSVKKHISDDRCYQVHEWEVNKRGGDMRSIYWKSGIWSGNAFITHVREVEGFAIEIRKIGA